MALLLAVVLAFSTSFAQSTPATETATQTYMRYRATIDSAKTVDEVVAFWTEDQRREFNAAPAAERVTLDDMRKGYARQVNVRVVKEDPTPTSSMLFLTAETPDKKPLAGIARFRRENGTWKMTGAETWESK